MPLKHQKGLVKMFALRCKKAKKSKTVPWAILYSSCILSDPICPAPVQ